MTQRRIVSALENSIRSHPQNDALVTGDEVITYRQFGEYVDEFVAKLQASTRRGEFVGIEATRTPSSIVAMVGAMIAECPFVFIDPRDSTSSNAGKVSSLDIEVVARTADGSPVPVLATASTLPWGTAADQDPAIGVPTGGDRIGYAIHTSGSTGEPKCVLVRVDPLARVIEDHVRQLEVTPESRTLQFARLTFDGCITEILWTLTAGACLVILPEERLRPGAMLGATLENYRVTHLKTTPFALTATDPTSAMSLRHVVNGGGACRPALMRKWSEVAAFHNAYGLTETTICNLLSDPLTPDECADGVPLGKLVGEGDYHLESLPLSTEDGTRRGPRGELVITGGCVAFGYLTPTGVRRFLDANGVQIYRTGDVVEMRGGELYFVERVDRQVKVRGYRIDPGEIESAACRLDGVVEAVVTAESHDGSDQAAADALVCYYLGAATPREVRGHLEVVLDGYKVPSVIQQIDTLPYTRNGKVDRDALRASRQATRSEQATVPAAEQVLQLARHLTGVADAGLNDNFFDIGGDSASTLILVNRLKELGWMDVGVRDVLRAENLESLVLELSERSV
ncbi:non-ribosomal peptide synthetase [Micromonospora sp. D93]|uniref:non-ribosomal peptide synthetase n=1 Tax=Micromonospora sp. D93 TaxID=2824886 RepID=UPI001B37A61B|nr:non-ribosomal peptide synthetase [Micromonospora sp. D93]MBQ1017631.1 non-ribosomal peptide synthetase [Micromonospora sp. D93]